MPEQRVMTIQPRDGLLGDPAVPVRVGLAPTPIPEDYPPLGLTSMSVWLFVLAGGLFLAATGAGIVTGNPMVHALSYWAAILLAHFAVSYFIWVDPLPDLRFVAIPIGVTSAWGACALSLLLLAIAPAWIGWALVVVGLLAAAGGAVPLGAAWVQPLRNPFHYPLEV